MEKRKKKKEIDEDFNTIWTACSVSNRPTLSALILAFSVNVAFKETI